MFRRQMIVLMDFATKTVAIDIHRNFRSKILSALSKLDRARTTSGWVGKAHAALVFMHRRQMILQMKFPGKAFATDIASKPRV